MYINIAIREKASWLWRIASSCACPCALRGSCRISRLSSASPPCLWQLMQVTAATADDIKKDVSVYDQSGELVGKVDSVDSDGAIVNTGKARAEIPLTSFGKNDKGLVVSVTKADLDAKAKTETKPKT